MAERTRVGLVFGGRSGEHEVSILSAAAIFDALDRDRYDVFPIGVDREGRWRLGSSRDVFVNAADVRRASIDDRAPEIVAAAGDGAARLLDAATARVLAEVDVFFPILHGTFGEDGSFQGLARLLDVPYVGPDVRASALAMDKDLSKRLLAAAGVPVARQTVVRADRERPGWGTIVKRLGPTVFVKPANLGSSVGIHRANSSTTFADALDEALRFDTKAVVEEAIEGREIECAVLGNESPEASRPGEIVPRHDFYSYEAKYVDADGAALHAPADLDTETAARVRALAIRAYVTLGCEGMSRVDLFLRPSGELLVNEVNTLPGFTRISMYPKLWDVTGLPFPRLLDRLVELALERHRRDRTLLRAATPVS